MAFAMMDFNEEDYREKRVKGIVTDGKRFDECSVVVRMTNDERRQTLSLTVNDSIMIAISLESVNDIIKVSEKGEQNETDN